MNKRLHILNKILITAVLWVLAMAPAMAQKGIEAWVGEQKILSVVPYPGETYEWTLYKDPTLNFATAPSDVSANEAVFVGGNIGASVNVLWKKQGTYFFRVIARKPYLKNGCETMNLKIGIVEVKLKDEQKFITICQGDVAIFNLPITSQMGSGPFSVTYTNGLKETTINGVTENRIIIRPETNTTYTLIQIKDEPTGKILVTEKQILGVVTINPRPIVSLSDKDTLYLYKPLELKVGSKNDSLYLWNDGSTAQTFVADKEGEVYVMVTNKYGCKASDSVVIRLCNYNVYMPTAFTPNGDKLNDAYKPVIPTDRDRPKRYRMDIYNKWGQRLFTTNNIDEGWDGIYKGLLCPLDTYTYSIEFWGAPYEQCNNNNPMVGTFTLLK